MARAYLPLALRWKIRSQERGSISSHVLVLILGVALGVGAMWAGERFDLWRASAEALTVDAGHSTNGAQAPRFPATTRDRLAKVLELTVTYPSRPSVRLPAVTVALADGRVGLITALDALLDARSVLVPIGGGRAISVPRVLAVAPELQLVMLGLRDAPGGGTMDALTPATGDDAGLYLGRPVSLSALGGLTVAGFVDSPAQRSELGAYWYALSDSSGPISTPAAILDGDGRLLGVAARPALVLASADGVAGLDVQALAPLLSAVPALESDLADFVETFFSSNEIGRLLAVERSARAADWTAVIAGGTDLMYLSYPIAERTRPLLEQAFQVAIADALTRNAGVAPARQLLDQASRLLGWTAARRVLAARVARVDGDVAEALSQLNLAQQEAQAVPDTQASLREAARRLLGDLLASNQLSEEQAAALLQGQLQLDPEYAPYHAALGRLLFGQARYREALTPLYRARALDGRRYAEEFDSLIALAEERLYAPDVTVVPVLSQGATLFVTGTIPGTSGTYRFILDTGASITAISPRVAAQLPGLVSRGSVRLTTANGEVDAPLVTLPSLDVAGARVAQLDVVVLDSLASYDGLLGLSFLDHFNMELDRNRNEMTLRLR